MDTVFFVVAKALWAVFRPETLINLLLIVGVGLLLLRLGRAAALCLGPALAAIAAITVLPVGELAIGPLERRFPSAPELRDIDGIVILGGSLQVERSERWGTPALAESSERVLAGLALARAHPEARVVYSGGAASLTRPETVEADVAGRIFRDFGIADDRLILERRSRNTAENAARSAALAAPAAGETWALVTSAYHMPRAVGAFCAVGWPVVPYPVDYRSGGPLRPGIDYAGHLGLLNTAVKEWGGLAVYYLTGRSDSPFPDGCR